MARTDGLTPWWHKLKGLHGHDLSCNGVVGTFCYPTHATDTWEISIAGTGLSGSEFLRRADCRSKNPKKSIKFIHSGLSLEDSAVYHATEDLLHTSNGGVSEGSTGWNRHH